MMFVSRWLTGSVIYQGKWNIISEESIQIHFIFRRAAGVLKNIDLQCAMVTLFTVCNALYRALKSIKLSGPELFRWHKDGMKGLASGGIFHELSRNMLVFGKSIYMLGIQPLCHSTTLFHSKLQLAREYISKLRW